MPLTECSNAASAQWRRDHPNRAQHKLSEAEKRTMAAFESLDYEVTLNAPYLRERQRLRRWISRRLATKAGNVT